jgi:hypothetical protein
VIQLGLPMPFEKQRAILEHPARFKVVRAVRRFSKSVGAMIAGLAGHGPRVTPELIGDPDFPHATEDRLGRPLWPGVAEGWTVIWLAPDYTQSDALWMEEIQPRWGGHPNIVLRESSPRSLSIRDNEGRVIGLLQLATMENVRSIRGRGHRVIGVIVEEAAWLDLERAWRHVLRPLLMDNRGWAVFISTTNAGEDGNREKRVPSYFNLLCEQIMAGELSERWAHFHGTVRDNPKIAPAEVTEFLEDYPEGSIERSQEVEADLLQPQGGLAFPEFDPKIHVRQIEPEQGGNWRWIGSGDWGKTAPGVCYLTAIGEGNKVVVRYEWYFNGGITSQTYTAYEAGYAWGQQIKRFPRPEWHVMDCPPVSDGPTILERFQAGLDAATGTEQRIPCVHPPKGPGYRATCKSEMHHLLAYRTDPEGKILSLPQLVIHPDCTNLIRTVQKLPRDPKKMEEVWNNGAVEDHPFEGFIAGAMARLPQVERTEKAPPKDKHPGLSNRWKRYMQKQNAEVVGPRYKRWSPGVEDDEDIFEATYDPVEE